MSSRRSPGKLDFVMWGLGLAVGIFGLAGYLGFFRDDEPVPPVAARLVAEEEEWALVMIKDVGEEQLHLRSRGVDVQVDAPAPRTETPPGGPAEYRIELVTLPGASRPTFYGLLPEGAARAEAVSAQTGEQVTLKVRTSGALTHPFVVQAAPGAAEAWRDGDRVTVRVYDDRNRPLLPG